MKNSIKAIFLVAVIALLGGCTDDEADGTGTLIINLGGGAGETRAVNEWPPDAAMLKDIEFHITLSGASGEISIDAAGGTAVKTTLSAGNWDIAITAFLKGDLYAQGAASTEVKPGKNVSVTIPLRYAGEIAHVHQWGEWTQTKVPTETEEGEETRTCALDAAHKETRPIAMLSHTHNWGTWEITTPSTCTTAGEETRTCTLNATHTETRPIAINPDAHDLGEWSVSTPATCTTAGEETRTCTLDAAHKETRSITALGHSYANWTQTTAPTCTTAGVETGTCTRDSSHTTTRPITALGHNYGPWVVTKLPSQDEEGEETRTCSHDATHTETRPVEKK